MGHGRSNGSELNGRVLGSDQSSQSKAGLTGHKLTLAGGLLVVPVLGPDSAALDAACELVPPVLLLLFVESARQIPPNCWAVASTLDTRVNILEVILATTSSSARVYNIRGSGPESKSADRVFSTTCSDYNDDVG